MKNIPRPGSPCQVPLSPILQGDARHLPIKNKSVNCVVTSPPYWGLRDYGVEGQIGLEPTPDLYVSHLVEVFREVWRVLRDDGTLWLNLGDSYAANGVSGLSIKGDSSTLVGSANSAHAVQRKVVPYGLKPKDLVGIPWRVAFALQADGWYLRSDIIWSKPNPMPESVTDRPTKAHEYLFLLAKSERYYYDAEAISERAVYAGGDAGYAGYSARAIAMGRNPSGNEKPGAAAINGDTRNRRSVWTISTQPYPEAHFATFPEDLVKPCVLAGCHPGGIVLDPFSGSGTVVKVAQDLGRRGIGVELNPKYTNLAYDRSRQLGLMESTM